MCRRQESARLWRHVRENITNFQAGAEEMLREFEHSEECIKAVMPSQSTVALRSKLLGMTDGMGEGNPLSFNQVSVGVVR